MIVCLFAILTDVLADTDIFLPSTGAQSNFMKLMLGFTFGEQQGALSTFVLSDCLFLVPDGNPLKSGVYTWTRGETSKRIESLVPNGNPLKSGVYPWTRGETGKIIKTLVPNGNPLKSGV